MYKKNRAKTSICKFKRGLKQMVLERRVIYLYSPYPLRCLFDSVQVAPVVVMPRCF